MVYPQRKENSQPMPLLAESKPLYIYVVSSSDPTGYHQKASSIGGVKGIKFLLETFWNIFLFRIHNLGLLKSKLFEK